jgi:hypothetical protein
LDALIARRRALGLDTHDEVWNGEYHMAPAAHSSHGWLDDQLAVPLYPLEGRYEQVEESRLLGPDSRGLAGRIKWPADD